jgi:ketosteroid isomerase-like protein
MSQENIELARRSYEAFTRRDLAALLELMDDDIQVVSGSLRWKAAWTVDGLRRRRGRGEWRSGVRAGTQC